MGRGSMVSNAVRVSGAFALMASLAACGDAGDAGMRTGGEGEQARDMTGSVVQGRFAAQRWCATCHAVDGAEPATQAGAPPFSAIAARPDVTRASLLDFMDDTHPVYSVGAPIDMPTDVLYEREKADLIAYILSLRPDGG